jgi:hypothetical protein
VTGFGWVGSFLLVGEPHFLVIITIHYLPTLVSSPPGIVSLLSPFLSLGHVDLFFFSF